MSVSNISKKQLFEEIINIVFENKDTFKEGDYITLNEKLMKLYNEVNEDDEDSKYNEDEEDSEYNEDDYEIVNDERVEHHSPKAYPFIRDTLEYIIKQVYFHKEENYTGYNGATFNIYLELEMHRFISDYSEELIKTIIIPLLQSRGFDIKLFYYDPDDYYEMTLYKMYVEWEYNTTETSACRMEYFPKKSDKYFFDE